MKVLKINTANGDTAKKYLSENISISMEKESNGIVVEPLRTNRRCSKFPL